MRTGLVAKKLGMSQLFLSDGESVAVTLLHVEPCTIIGQKVSDRDGYDALQLGFVSVSSNRLTKPMRGFFEKRSLPFFKNIKEFKVDKDNLVDVGSKIDAAHFKVGQFVDVSGNTVGKGFAGGMKRHGFKGLRASHGVSVTHRSHGSTGNRQDPGKVFKNKKMAGHLGTNRVTVLNLQICRIDSDQGVLFVKGAIPGSVGSLVCVRDAIKKDNLHAS